MLRYVSVLICLLLVLSCSKRKSCSEATDPRTGECISAAAEADAAKVASLQAQLEAQTQQIQKMLQEDEDKKAEIRRLRDVLENPNSLEEAKNKAKRELSALGVNFALQAATLGLEEALKWLNNDILGNSEPPTNQGSQGAGGR